MRDLLGNTVVGLGLGFVLSRMGFSSWDEVHGMFTFSDFRLLGGFALGVAVLALAWPTIVRLSRVKPQWPPRPLHRGIVWGSLLFGAGWALSGACPSIVFVQLGEGQLFAAFTLTGIFAGNWIYAWVHERFFRWDPGSCLDE